jgi:Response regulator containing a CheY-like receiver domain and an HTH DNA-binding domain
LKSRFADDTIILSNKTGGGIAMALFDWWKRKKHVRNKAAESSLTDSQDTENKAEQSAAEKLDTLTQREYETFLILIEGYTLRFAAEQMGIGYPTVNTYQTAIYKKPWRKQPCTTHFEV